MASESELADLYLSLRAVNAPMLASFSETASAGEEMVVALSGAFAEIDATIARTAESLAGLRAEMAGVAEGVAGAGVSAATGAAEAAVPAATARGTATADTAAARAVKAENDKLIASAAKVSASADEMAIQWQIDYAKMAAATAAASAKFEAANAEAVEATTAVGAAMDGTAAKSATASSSIQGKLAVVGLAAGGVAIEAGKMAADFQTSTQKLVTSGGESEDALKNIVTPGLLHDMGQFGVSADDITAAMYKISSGGFTAANGGLDVLKAALEGGKMEGADFVTAGDAVTDILTDYGLKGKDATRVMSQLVETTSLGKTTLGQLAGSLHSVIPQAAAVNVSAADVEGAFAEMTTHGMSADQTTQNLSHTLGKMQNSTAPMRAEFAQLGISAQQLDDSLASKGLTGTLDIISDAIRKKMGPANGKIVLDAMNSSKQAADNFTEAIKKAPAPVAALGKALQDGSMSYADYTKAIKALPANEYTLASSFSGMYQQANGFTNALKNGSPQLQSYAQAMQAATGDSVTLKTALMLTGDNATPTAQKVAAIAAATTDAAGNVKGWSDIQNNMNQRLSQAKGAAEALFIQIGTKLLPVFTVIVHAIAAVITTLSQHKVVATSLALVIGVVLVGAFTMALIAMGKMAVGMVTGPIKAFADGRKAVGEFASNVSSGMAGAEGATATWGGKIGSVLGSIGSGLGRLGGALRSGVTSVATWAANTTKQFVVVAASAVRQAAATVAAWVASMVRMAATGIAQLATWMAGMIADFSAVAVSAVVEAATVAAAWVAANIAMIAATGGIILLVAAIIGLVVLIVTHWSQIKTFFVDLWKKVQKAFDEAKDHIKRFVSDTISAVTGWVTKLGSAIGGFFTNLKDKIGTWLKGWVDAIKSGLHDAYQKYEDWSKSVEVAVGNFFTQMPSKIGKWIDGWVSKLKDGWDKAVDGVKKWLEDMNQKISDYFHSIPKKIGDFFSGAGKWLWNAGVAILKGLWDGIKAEWDNFANFIGGIGSWISDHKGPIEYDRTLLTPHGNAIMQGLLAGLRQGGAHVASYLTGFTQNIGALGAGSLNGSIDVNGSMALPTSSGSSMLPAATSGAATSGGITIAAGGVQVTVMGSVQTEANLVRALQQGILQLAGRNAGFGLNPAFQ